MNRNRSEKQPKQPKQPNQPHIKIEYVKMDYGMKFPNYVKPGDFKFEHHKKFTEFRAWLEATVGEQYKTWDFVTGDMHASAILFKNEADLTAFKLKFSLE